MTERTVIIQADGRMKCGRCGYRLRKATDWHPRWYCGLVSIGLDPHKEVREAAKHLPPAVPPFVSRQVDFPDRSLRAVKEGAS